MDEFEFYDGAWTGQEIDAGIGLTGTLANALAVVLDGNKAAASASVGQYVLVKNSTITSVSDGLYTAAQAIPANTAIDATYLTAVSKGGLNDLIKNLVLSGRRIEIGSVSGSKTVNYVPSETFNEFVVVVVGRTTNFTSLWAGSFSSTANGQCFVYKLGAGGTEKLTVTVDTSGLHFTATASWIVVDIIGFNRYV